MVFRVYSKNVRWFLGPATKLRGINPTPTYIAWIDVDGYKCGMEQTRDPHIVVVCPD